MIFNKVTREKKVCGSCMDFNSDFGKTGIETVPELHIVQAFFLFAVYKCSKIKAESPA